MSIYKRPESKYWWYAIRIGRRYLRGSCETEDEATALAIEQTIRSAYKRSMPGDKLHRMLDTLLGSEQAAVATGLPLASLWTEYQRVIKTTGKQLAQVTLNQRKARCNSFAKWVAQYYPVVTCAEEVNRECASRYAEWLSKQGTKGKTRLNHINDLGTVWTTLQRTRSEIKENPWRFVRPETHDSRRLLAFSRDQEARVLKAADAAGHKWGLACRLARHTGLRKGDIYSLKWEQIDLTQALISVSPSKTQRFGIAVLLPLVVEIRQELAALRELEPNTVTIFSQADILAHDQHRFAKILTTAGIDKSEGYSFHSWRHTFRTRLSEAGVSDELAKRLGGWTEDQTAMRYDHADRVTELKAAVEAAAR